MSETNTSNDQHNNDSFSQFQVHESLLRDRPRVTAYYDAIMNNKHLFHNKVSRIRINYQKCLDFIRQFQVVLDVGCGTGILSMFAAKAGAKLVYAVDACPMICHLAEELIRSNHLQEKIRVINRRIEDIAQFDEQIDIILSEWMGKII